MFYYGKMSRHFEFSNHNIPIFFMYTMSGCLDIVCSSAVQKLNRGVQFCGTYGRIVRSFELRCDSRVEQEIRITQNVPSSNAFFTCMLVPTLLCWWRNKTWQPPHHSALLHHRSVATSAAIWACRIRSRVAEESMSLSQHLSHYRMSKEKRYGWNV